MREINESAQEEARESTQIEREKVKQMVKVLLR